MKARYNAAEVNYFYKTAYYNFYQTYEQYISSGYFFDPSQPLKAQYADADRTQSWFDYFMDSALQTMLEVTVLCNAAGEEGFVLSDEGAKELDEAMARYADEAKENDVGLSKYFRNIFGRGSSEKIIRELTHKLYLASEYSEHISGGFTYTGEEVAAHYAEKADDFDVIAFSSYYVDGSAGDTEDEAANDAAMAEAKKTADAVAESVTDVESFEAAVAEADPEGAVSANALSGSSLASYAYGEWLLDSGRKSGDVTVSEGDTGYTVVLFTGRDKNEYKMKAIRQILILAKAGEDGSFTDEAKSEALSSAQAVWDEWKNGEATEESFAALAEKYSQDSGTNTSGGLYEHVYKGALPENVDSFAFGAHEPGDTFIVPVESDSYFGYSVLYYVGEEAETYAYSLSDRDLRTTDYNAWASARFEGVVPDQKIGIKYAG